MMRTISTIAYLAACVLAFGSASSVHAHDANARVERLVLAKAQPRRPPARAPAPARAEAPVVTVTSTGPGQAGYVHYFVITGPDGEAESEVALELADGRIAWSFPGAGVITSDFVARGSLVVNGIKYGVEHLYGIRPFPDEASMRVLRQALAARVQRWLDASTPYCGEEQRSTTPCVSCLGFVLRVLYPGASPALPALPRDFRSARAEVYTTEDLLMYLAGVPVDAPSAVRLKRIGALDVPERMREELVRISALLDAAAAARRPLPGRRS